MTCECCHKSDATELHFGFHVCAGCAKSPTCRVKLSERQHQDEEGHAYPK